MKYARIRTLAAVLAGLAIGAQACAEELVVAVQSTFTTLDPYDASDTLSQAVAKSFYEGLYGFDRNMKRIPVLAESAEPSADGLVYTIKLKQGVKFHDGTEFTAEAVKANFDRVTDPKNGLKRYSPLLEHRQDRSARPVHGALYAQASGSRPFSISLRTPRAS